MEVKGPRQRPDLNLNPHRALHKQMFTNTDELKRCCKGEQHKLPLQQRGSHEIIQKTFATVVAAEGAPIN